LLIVLVSGFGCGVCFSGDGGRAGGARCARVRGGSARAGLCILSCREGGPCCSGGWGQGAEPLPADEECFFPWPVRADLQDALAGVMGESAAKFPPIGSSPVPRTPQLGHRGECQRRARRRRSQALMKQISTIRQSIPWNPTVSMVFTRFPHDLHTASTH
jgi:hypothetical protein